MKKVYYLLLILFLFFPCFVFAKEEVVLSKCVDGDTAKFFIDGKEKTVRFLAIDTEETKSTTKDNTLMGQIASFYTCIRLKLANTIEIEYDDNASSDKYGRDLGWIFIDDELLQETLVKKGYAKVAYLYGDYKYTDQLLEQEQIAKTARIGIWNNDNIFADIYLIVKKIVNLFT